MNAESVLVQSLLLRRGVWVYYRLRPIRTQQVDHQGQRGFLLSDPMRLSQKTVFVPASLSLLLSLMDGTRDIGTLRTGFQLRTGIPLSKSIVAQLVSSLDEALLLDNESYRKAHEKALTEYRSATSRPFVLAGDCYPVDATELNPFLQSFMDRAKDVPKPAGRMVGLVSPHIDFHRGGDVYGKVWHAAQEAVREAELVVILGTDHNEGDARITLTRQSYATPWGVVPTARDLVDEFAETIGDPLFECELNHRWEHSIETAVVWLHYLCGDTPCAVLPVLCGSFQPFIESGESPLTASHIRGVIGLLKQVVRRRRTLVVAAADLAHVGPAFGDPAPLDVAARARLSTEDERLIDIMSNGQAEGFFAEVAADGDRRNICGIPPIFVMLAMLSGATGTLVDYTHCPASEDGSSVVSICGVVYHA